MRVIAPTMLALCLALSGCATSSSPATPAEVRAQVLHRGTASWDGAAYPRYPEGAPVLSLVKLDIPPNTTLDWHCHQGFNLGHVMRGSLNVETRDGRRTQLKPGDTLAELVNDVHRGRTGSEATTVMVFHAGTEALPFSTPAAQCGQPALPDAPIT